MQPDTSVTMLSNQSETVRLAGQAASLSTGLYAAKEKCQHEMTGNEISAIADELARLSTTLWHLNDAINADPMQYTDAFNEDLTEINIELTCLFEEISECCAGLQMADSNVSTVSWFFKKGRVARLLKHLEALKGTLAVMRTVLWHGKDYGTHTSDRVAESSPHTMREDRIILESVLARNRSAILDLHDLTSTVDNGAASRTERTSSKAGGDHHRQLSEATGVEIPPIPDVLPLSIADSKEKATDQPTPPKLKKTFSKRGVRLGVHRSILDLSAHEAPLRLKKKWLQQAHVRQQIARQNDRRGLTALPELSRISEVDTNAGSSTNLSLPHPQKEPQIPTNAEDPITETPNQTTAVPFNTPTTGALQDTTNTPTALKIRSSTVGSKLRRVMSRISMSNLRSPTRTKSLSQANSEASTIRGGKGKEREEELDDEEVSVLEMSPGMKKRLARVNVDQENRSGRKPFMESLRHRFERIPLNTPEKERKFEYGKA